MSFTDEQIKCLKLLLEVQANAYNDSINRMHNDINEYKTEQEVRYQEIKTSLEFTQKEYDDLKKEFAKLKEENGKLYHEVTNLNRTHHTTIPQIKEFEDRLDYLDDKQRKCNLIVSGLTENEVENNEQSHKNILQFFEGKMNLPNMELVAAHRLGRPRPNNIRDILVKFRNQDQRDAVFKKKKCLQGNHVFIREDYCKSTQDIRKQLLPKLQEARKQGKVAFLDYRELVIKRTQNKPKINSATNVQDVVQRIEALSPLPSPLLSRTPPRTPPPQSAESSRTELRLKPRIKYPK